MTTTAACGSTSTALASPWPLPEQHWKCSSPPLSRARPSRLHAMPRHALTVRR
ncbi:hypothetical protein AB0M29_11195 [Streptomyces sp. NPDC051976]|uniref:hypothetical protein n=1 Tax=Streptomyces sp. NPDC051976 TaxID=3154947 RepID=UPI003441453C